MNSVSPLDAATVVIGGGTMGADVAVVLARGGARVTVVEPHADQRARLLPHVAKELRDSGFADQVPLVQTCASPTQVNWAPVSLAVECITERLPAKQALFAELERHAPASAVLASNSSSFPISAIAQRLHSRARMLGLHFFMPAHLVPLVEVVLGPDSDPALAQALCAFMRGCGSVPVLVRWLSEHGLDAQAFDTEYGDEDVSDVGNAATDEPASP